MYTKVRILIGVGDIAQQEITAPIRIHYKVKGAPNLQGEIGMKLVEILKRRSGFG